MIWLDEYDRKARLLPGLVASLPVVVAVVSLGIKANPVITTLVGVGSTMGFVFVLSSAVRSRGLAMQVKLFRIWNGPPTTHALRNRGSEWPSAQRQRWRDVTARVTSCELPDESEEIQDPASSDGKIDVAVRELRTMTEGKAKFPMLFMENRNFGYERNLLAMRPAGLILALISALSLGVVEALHHSGRVHGVSLTSLTIGIAVDLVIGAFWMLVPSERRAWLVGKRYAEQLFAAASQVGDKVQS